MQVGVTEWYPTRATPRRVALSPAEARRTPLYTLVHCTLPYRLPPTRTRGLYELVPMCQPDMLMLDAPVAGRLASDADDTAAAS